MSTKKLEKIESVEVVKQGGNVGMAFVFVNDENEARYHIPVEITADTMRDENNAPIYSSYEDWVRTMLIGTIYESE